MLCGSVFISYFWIALSSSSGYLLYVVLDFNIEVFVRRCCLLLLEQDGLLCMPMF